MPINRLLSEVLEAYGGLERWRKFSAMSATIITGGEFWGMKGLVQDAGPRRMTIDLRREWGSLDPFGNPDWHAGFTPDRIATMPWCDSRRAGAQDCGDRSGLRGW